MLNELRYEMRDVFPEYPDLLLAFLSIERRLSQEYVDLILMELDISEEWCSSIRDALLWFSFLGIVKEDVEHYAYDFLYNVPKLKALVKDASASDAVFVIHPAFRKALETNRS